MRAACSTFRAHLDGDKPGRDEAAFLSRKAWTAPGVAGARPPATMYRFAVGILEMDYAARNTCRGTPARPLFLRRDDAMPARHGEREVGPPPPSQDAGLSRIFSALPVSNEAIKHACA